MIQTADSDRHPRRSLHQAKLPLADSLIYLIASAHKATLWTRDQRFNPERKIEPKMNGISQTLADWYEENGREGDSAQIDLSRSAWQTLRDTELIAKSRLLHKKLTEALASDAAALAEYDLTPADATLARELADFEAISADPAAAISRRRALTLTLRPKFREISQLLKKMDRLVLRFRKTESGTAFATAWAASRIVRDLGGSAPAEPSPTPGA